MSETIVLERLPASPDSKTLFDRGRLKRRRVYIFLTRQGFVFALMLMVMLLGAVNYNNSMAYILTFLLGSLFMVCMLHTYRNLRGLIISAANPAPVFAGQTANFPLLFDNRFGTDRVAVKIQPHDKNTGFGLMERDSENYIYADILAYELHRVYLKIAGCKRGFQRLGRIRISSTFPLGLFRAWSYMESTRRCIVYPGPAGNPLLPEAVEYESEELTGKRPGTDDFTGFRTYRPGDSIRSIDWKAVAREQGLLIKRFSGGGANTIIFQWRHTEHIHDTESRLSQLCRWVIEADKQACHYGLDIPGTYIDIGSGDSHKHKCLAALAGYGSAESGC